MEWGRFYYLEEDGLKLVWNLKKIHAFTGIGTTDPKTACGLRPRLDAIRVDRQRTRKPNGDFKNVTFFGFLDPVEFNETNSQYGDFCSKCQRKLAYPFVHLSDKLKDDKERKNKHWTKLEESIAAEKEAEESKAALPPLDPEAWGFVRFEQETAHGLTKLNYFEWLETQGFEHGINRVHESKATKEINGIDKVRA